MQLFWNKVDARSSTMKKPWRKKPQQRREGFDGVGAAGPRVWQPGRLAYAPAAGAPTGGSGGASLRELARRRLWAEVLGSLGAPGAGVVLLVDDVTMRILSSLFRLSEVMEAGVHLVENLTMKGADGNYLRRQPLPDLPAVYLLTPSVESVNRFIDDFRADTPPAYRSAHLFFSSRLSDSLMGKLRKSNALPHVAALKEVAMELVMHESNVFVTPASTAAFHALFRGDSSPRTSHSKLQVGGGSGADKGLNRGGQGVSCWWEKGGQGGRGAACSWEERSSGWRGISSERSHSKLQVGEEGRFLTSPHPTLHLSVLSSSLHPFPLPFLAGGLPARHQPLHPLRRASRYRRGPRRGLRYRRGALSHAADPGRAWSRGRRRRRRHTRKARRPRRRWDYRGGRQGRREYRGGVQLCSRPRRAPAACAGSDHRPALATAARVHVPGHGL